MDDDDRPRRDPLFSENKVVRSGGKTETIYSKVGYADPVCNKCKNKTTSHVDHTGAVWCHKCWVKHGIGELERRWKEERERMRKKKEEIRQLAEASFVQAVVKAAEKVTAEEVQEAVHEDDPPVDTMDAVCAKCGVRPAVTEYELEENEEWADPPMKKAYLCAECANVVFPKEYDDEDGGPDIDPDDSVCATHGVPGHDCEEG